MLVDICEHIIVVINTLNRIIFSPQNVPCSFKNRAKIKL